MRVPIDRRSFLQLVGGAGAWCVGGCGGAEVAPTRPEPTVPPAPAPIAPPPLARAPLDRLHAQLAGYVERREVPGVIAMIARGDDVYVDVIGSLDATGKVPLRRDSMFRIASMTKPVTGAATMILVDEGTLRLDEPVDRLLPELAGRRVLRTLGSKLDDTVPAARPIRVRDLLTFTMGFGLLFEPPGTYPIQLAIDTLSLGQGMPAPQKVPGPDEWLRRLATLPLMHQPGERWMYNTGADVLGVLIARASGQPFEAFLRDRIFEPLDMKDTSFAVPAEKRDRFVTSYVTDPETHETRVYDEPGGQWSTAPAFPSGAGGLVSTADDFLAFGRMLLDGGAKGRTRILSARAAQQMTTDQLSRAQKAASTFPGDFFASHGWGLCQAIVTGRDPSGAPGAFGWDGGLGTTWRSDPQRRTVTIALTQQAFTSPEPPPILRDVWAASAEAAA